MQAADLLSTLSNQTRVCKKIKDCKARNKCVDKIAATKEKLELQLKGNLDLLANPVAIPLYPHVCYVCISCLITSE